MSSNGGDENIFITYDAGSTWKNVTGDLKKVSGLSKIRPGGVIIIELLKNNDRALLVGTSNGIYVTYLGGSAGQWTRFGACLPIVLTKKLSYEHYSDTLVAATFGRGIYIDAQCEKGPLEAPPLCVWPPLHSRRIIGRLLSSAIMI